METSVSGAASAEVSLSSSPSQTETFFKCRFLHFCQYTLRLNPRRTAEVAPVDAGTLTHKLLQTLLPLYYEADIVTVTPAEAAAHIKAGLAQGGPLILEK